MRKFLRGGYLKITNDYLFLWIIFETNKKIIHEK